MVALCLDGGNKSQREHGVPWLLRHQIPFVAFLTPLTTLEDLPLWKKAVDAGAEIGNGFLIGQTENGALLNWTRDMVRYDAELGQKFFKEFLGCAPRVTALDGWSHDCCDGSYLPELKAVFDLVVTQRPDCERNPESKEVGSWQWDQRTDLPEPAVLWLDEWTESVAEAVTTMQQNGTEFVTLAPWRD